MDTQLKLSKAFWFNFSIQLKNKGLQLFDVMAEISNKQEYKKIDMTRYFIAITNQAGLPRSTVLAKLVDSYGLNLSELFDFGILDDAARIKEVDEVIRHSFERCERINKEKEESADFCEACQI